MKKLALLFLVLFGLSIIRTEAQIPVYQNLIFVSTAPSGSCNNGSPAQIVISTGVLYTCQAGAWAIVPSSGGGGTLPGGTAGQLQFNNAGASFGGFTLGGDATLNTSTGVLTVTKTSGVAFGTAATVNTGTSGATIPLLNANNTFSGNDTFSGGLTLPTTYTVGSFTLTQPGATGTLALTSQLPAVTTNTGTTFSPTYYSSSTGLSGVTPFTGLEYFPGSAAPVAASAAQVVAVIGSTPVANATAAAQVPWSGVLSANSTATLTVGGGGTLKPLLSTSTNTIISDGWQNSATSGTFGTNASTAALSGSLNAIPYVTTASSINGFSLCVMGTANCAALLGSGGFLAVAQGGTGIGTPGLIQGTNITITGTWPNQTINASGGSGSVTSFAASSGSWPTWLVPTVSNATTTPSLAVAAGQIPITAVGSAGLSGSSPISIAATGVISCTTCNTSSGSVSSVALVGSNNIFSSTPGTPITSSGTLNVDAQLVSQLTNIFLGNISGSTTTPVSNSVNLLFSSHRNAFLELQGDSFPTGFGATAQTHTSFAAALASSIATNEVAPNRGVGGTTQPQITANVFLYSYKYSWKSGTFFMDSGLNDGTKDTCSGTTTSNCAINYTESLDAALGWMVIPDTYRCYGISAVNSGTYSAGTTYNIGSVVSSSSILYISIVSGNIGNTPVSSPSNWAIFQTPAGLAGTTSSIQAQCGSSDVIVGTWAVDATIPVNSNLNSNYNLFPGGYVVDTTAASASVTKVITDPSAASSSVGVTFGVANSALWTGGAFTLTIDGVAQTDQCSLTTTFTSTGCGGTALAPSTTTNLGSFFRQWFTVTPAATHTIVFATTSGNSGHVNFASVDVVPAATAIGVNQVIDMGPNPDYGFYTTYNYLKYTEDQKWVAKGLPVWFISEMPLVITAQNNGAYTVAPTCSVSGGTLLSGTAVTSITASVVSGALVYALPNVATPGLYSVAPTVSCTGGTGSGASVTLTAFAGPGVNAFSDLSTNGSNVVPASLVSGHPSDPGAENVFKTISNQLTAYGVNLLSPGTNGPAAGGFFEGPITVNLQTSDLVNNNSLISEFNGGQWGAAQNNACLGLLGVGGVIRQCYHTDTSTLLPWSGSSGMDIFTSSSTWFGFGSNPGSYTTTTYNTKLGINASTGNLITLGGLNTGIYTASTSGACFSPSAHTFLGTYFTGSASAQNIISLTPTCTAGTNGAETLTVSDSGSTGTFTFAVTGNLTVSGTINGSSVTKQHEDYWSIGPVLFATSTMVGPVYYEVNGGTLIGITARLSGSITCATAPTINILDLGTSVSTVYASGTSLNTLATGTSDGAFTSIGLSNAIAAGHYVGLGFSAGSCVTAPQIDATITVQ